MQVPQPMSPNCLTVPHVRIFLPRVKLSTVDAKTTIEMTPPARLQDTTGGRNQQVNARRQISRNHASARTGKSKPRATRCSIFITTLFLCCLCHTASRSIPPVNAAETSTGNETKEMVVIIAQNRKFLKNSLQIFYKLRRLCGCAGVDFSPSA